MRRLLALLALAVAIGLGLGLFLLALRLREYTANLLIAAPPLAARSLSCGLLVAGGAVLLGCVAVVLVPRRAHRADDSPLVMGIALWLPLSLVIGWLVNRHLLPGFTEPASLAGNALLAALLFAALSPFARGLKAWRRRWLDFDSRPPWRILAGLLAVPLGAWVWNLWPAPQPRRPNVVVVVIDVLRADRLGCYGYARPTTPHIDRLAGDGVLFEQAIAQSTFTKTSVASLFTGLYPHRHGVYVAADVDEHYGPQLAADVLPDELTTLAERLSRAGVLTVAWVQNVQLQAAMGFAQGFDRYRDQPGKAATIVREFREWQRSVGWRRPFFAYLHILDLHEPYRPPPPWDVKFGHHSDRFDGMDMSAWRAYRRGVREGTIQPTPAEVEQLLALYDGALAYVDTQVGQLLADLRTNRLYDETLIVFTGDHGDAFLEHGVISHSHTPYEELIRVPLIVKLPRSARAGVRVGQPVALVDVAPTLLELLGVDAADGGDGLSLAGVLADGAAPPGGAARQIFSEHLDTMAVRSPAWKYIYYPERPGELYDLLGDPGERIDVVAARPEIVEALAPAVRQALDAKRSLDTAKAAVDPATRLKLEALGYLDP